MTKEWTDLDYAQAAIDMLPGTVEEIEEFMRAQRVRNTYNPSRRSLTCPIAVWVRKWVDTDSVRAGFFNVYVDNEPLPFPTEAIKQYVLHADRTAR